ncbi:MAG: hypothetical protein ABI811_10225 [Acidobacteriota bacterium]
MTTSSGAIVDLKNLIPGALLDVETKSRHYLIECLGGNEIRISGHPDYCPQPVSALLQGSIDKNGVLESGLIERGSRLMFFLDSRPVTTSQIVSVHVNRPANAESSSSLSIH